MFPCQCLKSSRSAHPNGNLYLLGVEPYFLFFIFRTPVHNGVAMPPVFSLLWGVTMIFMSPPGKGSGAMPLKLKIDVKLPCKIL